VTIMITFEQNGFRFNYRVVGAAFRNDEVLLHRGELDDFWTLPGGRVEIGESSPNGLRREMREELGIDAEIGRLLWVVENFFRYENLSYHEVALYYLLAFPDHSMPMTTNSRFQGLEHDVSIEFQWFKLSELNRLQLYPCFLAQALKSLPANPVHIVHSDA